MTLKNLKHFIIIFTFFSFLWFLNACQEDIVNVDEKQKTCNKLNQTLNEMGVKYYNTSSLTADTVIKNQSCEAYLKALLEFTNARCLTKSDSINNARMLATVHCKCTDALNAMNIADLTFKNSSTLSKDSVLRNNNCEALSRQLKSYINIGAWYKCVSKDDSLKYTQRLNGLGCKCTDALNIVKFAESTYKKIQTPADSAKNCKVYAQALTSYVKIGSSYKCLSTSDSTAYAKILSGLKCK